MGSGGSGEWSRGVKAVAGLRTEADSVWVLPYLWFSRNGVRRKEGKRNRIKGEGEEMIGRLVL